MSHSILIRPYLLVSALIVSLFTFNVSLVSAGTVSNKSTNCNLNLGLSACRISSLSPQSALQGLFKLYNDKLSLTAGKVGTPDEVTARLREQLDQLTLTLASIKLAVQNSKTMTEVEKQIFFKQIEIIELQIKQLRMNLDPKSEMFGTDFSVPTPPVPEADKKSAKDAKLDSIFVTFDNDKDEAEVVLKYKSGTKILNLTFEAVAKVTEFYSKMKVLKESLTMELSNSQKIFAVDIKDLIRISTRNPVREKPIGNNSPTAQKLYDNFALQSIINKIIIEPGDFQNGIIASAKLMTDQDEWIYATLSEGGMGTFTLQVQYFATTPFDKDDYDSYGNKIHYPKYTEVAYGLDWDGITSVLQDYFDDLKFSKSISKFGEKYTRFMIGNLTFFETDPQSSVTPKDSDLDCYPGSDKSIVNEFNNFLIDGLAFQVEPADKITSYKTWFKPAPDLEVLPRGCVSWNAF